MTLKEALIKLWAAEDQRLTVARTNGPKTIQSAWATMLVESGYARRIRSNIVITPEGEKAADPR